MAEKTVKMDITKTYEVSREVEVPAWMLEPGFKNDLENFLLTEAGKIGPLQIVASDWADTTVTDSEGEEAFSWS